MPGSGGPDAAAGVLLAADEPDPGLGQDRDADDEQRCDSSDASVMLWRPRRRRASSSSPATESSGSATERISAGSASSISKMRNDVPKRPVSTSFERRETSTTSTRK